ncbi:MAG: glycosyltransferase family 4 protein [Candidatus Caldatribacteriota bacterium]
MRILKNKSINILYFENVSVLGGAAIVLRNLIKEIKKEKGMNVVVACPEGELAEVLRKDGIRVEVVNSKRIVRTLNPLILILYILNFFQVNLKLLRIIRRHNINILHSNSLGAHIYSFFAAELAGIPNIWHLHDILKKRMSNRLLCNFLSKTSNQIIVVSYAVKKSLINFGINSNKIKVIYNGLDLDLWNPKKYDKNYLNKEFTVNKATIKVGIIGQLAEWKGQDILLNTAKYLIEKGYKNLRFYIIGDELFKNEDRYKDRLHQISKVNNLENYITFTGRRNDIPNILYFLDIVAVCSRYPDPLPTIILESMAMGKVVIGTNIGGIPEMIVNDETGILIPPNDPETLAKVILSLINQPGKIKEMGIKARERIKTKFSIKKNVEMIRNLYQELLMK